MSSLRGSEPFEKGKCPFCNRELGMSEKLKLKTVKKCKCNHCGMTISDKAMHW